MQARTLLRRMRDVIFGAGAVQQAFHVPLSEAEAIIEGLEKEGFIVKRFAPGRAGQQEPRWENTMKGNSLAMATAARPVTRATAERALAQFLDRVSTVNAEEEFAFRVERVVVFGSYLTSATELNDLDLLVDLAARYGNSTRQQLLEQSSVARAIRSGRRFRDSLEPLIWPRMEVEHVLKNRSRTLSLHYADHKLVKRTEHRVVFEARSGTDAGQ